MKYTIGDNEYEKPVTIHDKYAARPDLLAGGDAPLGGPAHLELLAGWDAPLGDPAQLELLAGVGDVQLGDPAIAGEEVRGGRQGEVPLGHPAQVEP